MAGFAGPCPESVLRIAVPAAAAVLVLLLAVAMRRTWACFGMQLQLMMQPPDKTSAQ